jgi:hypothetical protein
MSFGASGLAVNNACIVTGTLSGVVIFDVDAPQGEAEPHK